MNSRNDLTTPCKTPRIKMHYFIILIHSYTVDIVRNLCKVKATISLPCKTIFNQRKNQVSQYIQLTQQDYMKVTFTARKKTHIVDKRKLWNGIFLYCHVYCVTF